MKRIMFITLILLLFIGCSAVYAENSLDDNITADNTFIDENNDVDLSESVLEKACDLDDSKNLDVNESVLADADEGEYVDASGAYGYLNAFRTEENVWYWNADDSTQSHVNTNDTVWLKPLLRDVELENTAKIRAKEISEYFSHYRPDGSICFKIFPDGLLDYGENIAYGYEDSFAVTEGWKETNESYEGQGHRRSMLQASFNYVGIAGYKVNGVIYWVQNFGCRYDPKNVSAVSRFNFENNTVNPKFSVEVPIYASGNFEVYVNGTLISTNSVSNGKSDITVCSLNSGTYEILLSYSGDYNCNPFNQTETVVVPNHEAPSGTLRFNDLNTLIQMSGDEIKLENDYSFKTSTDSLFAQGIEINRQVTIDGQGHSIDAAYMARIFNIGFYEVTLKNLRLVNANLPIKNRYVDSSAYGVTCYSTGRQIMDGGAVYSRYPISIVNVTFLNNDASNGGAVFSHSNVYVENSTFENNTADNRGGAIYSSTCTYITNSSFKDNHAVDVGGAVYSWAIVDAENSIFKNNHNIGIFTDEFRSNNNTIVNGEYFDFFVNATADNGIVTLNRNMDASGTILINASNVIIDGNGYTIDAKSKSRLFNITGDNVTIKNLRFINGKSINEGGAIHVSSSCLTIINSTFENCIAQYGGVVYGNWTDIVIVDSTFADNEVKDFSGSEIAEGGVICTRSGKVSISNSTFTNNTAFYGAVVHTDSGMISFADSRFESNRALYYGGIVHSAGDVNVMNSDFLYNYASLYGGAIFCYEESRLLVKNSTFTNNTCYHYGGAISAAIEAEIIDSVFSSNFARDYAGAICLWGNLSVSNSNFTNNNAEVAAAIFDYFINGSVTITGSNFINNTQKTLGTLYFTTNVFIKNSTFANNRAYDGIGGAIVSEQNLTVLNSIFTNNSADRSWGYSVGGAIASYGENLNVDDSVFADSHVMRGGAIANFAKNAEIRNSIFTNNSAEIDGGAIFSYTNTVCSVSDSIFENNSAFDGGALFGANAVNCTFTQNRATNLASAMYGDSNTAKNCRFFKNIDYVEGPVYDVVTTECTFTDNRLIVRAYFNTYFMGSAYYQQDRLYMYLLNSQNSFHLSNATVTLRAYKNNALVGEFEFLSSEGWIVNITEGNYTFQFSVENQDYEADSVNATVTVIKKEVVELNIQMGNNTYLDVTSANITSNLDGSITVYLDDYYWDDLNILANKTIHIEYNYISAGSHTFKFVMTPADYHVDTKTFAMNFTVFLPHALLIPDVKIPNLNDGLDDGYVIVSVPDDVKATVTLSISGKTYVFDVTGSKVNVTLPDLANGNYDYSITYYPTSKYANYTDIGILTVNRTNASSDVKPVPEIVIPPLDEPSDDGSVTVTLPEDATGTVTLTINGNDYQFAVTNGKAKVVIPNLAEGNYQYTITYSGDDKYASFANTGSLNKLPPAVDPVIDAKDTNVLYTANGKYTVTVYGTDGKVAQNALVIFKINGKQAGKGYTNANGVATYVVKNVPGTYTISATALDASVTNKLTVKHVVTLKTVTLKKSAKKLTLQATLAKVNGKYLKKKTITFKINGKKVATAKTNAKGVAKVTINNPSVVKKLNVGKKATYQATYLKDTVKKTTKIKK